MLRFPSDMLDIYPRVLCLMTKPGGSQVSLLLWNKYSKSIWIILTSGGQDTNNIRDITTEIRAVNGNGLAQAYGEDLPIEMDDHNMIKVNHTHMVVFGGLANTKRVFMFDR